MRKTNEDYLIRNILHQFAVCVILIGLLFALKSTNSNFYYEIKDFVSDSLSENITKEEIESVYNTVKTAYEADMDNTSEEEYIPLEEPSLEAKVNAKGGADTKIQSSKDVPANASVKSYTLNKQMVIPVDGVISSDFGVRYHPVDGDLRFHTGIDIAADSGTPIYAAFDGTVTVSKYDQWNGNYIKLTHDNNITTVYCHCQSVNVSTGQNIKAGEVIGYVGSTGVSTGPHLHFELRINDVSYNPFTAMDDGVNAV